MVLGSCDFSDEQFLAALASGELAASQFRHADHLRLAWLWVRRLPLEQAEERVRATIQAFAQRHGVPGLYHETITRAWVRLIATHRETSFGEFLEENEYRLNRELLWRFWTPEVLGSEVAKGQWVEPDRHALPRA
jgi:hypothetical protein